MIYSNPFHVFKAEQNQTNNSMSIILDDSDEIIRWILRTVHPCQVEHKICLCTGFFQNRGFCVHIVLKNIRNGQASPGLLRSFPSRIFFKFSTRFFPTKPLLPVTRIFTFPPPSAVPVHSPLSRFSPPCRPHPEAGYCGWCTPHPLPL